MKRQLYYSLPDIAHTQKVHEELIELNIPDSSFHVVLKDEAQIDGINDVRSLNDRNRDYFLEWFLWRLNLSVFAIAFLSLVSLLIWQPSYYLFIPVAVMVITFLIGFYFSLRIPNVHWDEFVSAILHGEVLLIIDVPTDDLHLLDNVIHKRHPEAISGGVCWKA